MTSPWDALANVRLTNERDDLRTVDGFGLYLMHAALHGDAPTAWCAICIMEAERDGYACRFPRRPPPILTATRLREIATTFRETIERTR